MNQIPTEIVTIVKCSYCGIDMIDSELVCKECIPKLSIDIALNDMSIAIRVLQENKSSLTQERKKNIKSLVNEFISMIDNI